MVRVTTKHQEYTQLCLILAQLSRFQYKIYYSVTALILSRAPCSTYCCVCIHDTDSIRQNSIQARSSDQKFLTLIHNAFAEILQQHHFYLQTFWHFWVRIWRKYAWRLQNERTGWRETGGSACQKIQPTTYLGSCCDCARIIARYIQWHKIFSTLLGCLVNYAKQTMAYNFYFLEFLWLTFIRFHLFAIQKWLISSGSFLHCDTNRETVL